jgi:hypothetical protein
MRITRVNFLIFFLCQILIGCYSNHERVKAETTSKLLRLVRDHKYEEALQYFPYGIAKANKEADIKLLDKVSIILNQYGLPKKKNYLYEYTKGGNKASSSTIVTIPVYKASGANDSIIEIKIMVYFRDNIGDKNISWLAYDIRRKLEPFTPTMY